MSGAKIGTVIRAVRERRGLTQTALARKARVAQSYIAMMEAGTSVPKATKTLARIARALEVSMTELTAGRLVSRLGEDPYAPFRFQRGQRVQSIVDPRQSGTIADGICWYEPAGGSFVDLYQVRRSDGLYFNARSTEIREADK
jgi:transcriptional regulator with XRE-family HTH domain